MAKKYYKDSHYRIVEKAGRFQIQVLHTRITGFFNRKETQEWVGVDKDGDPRINPYQMPMLNFHSLEKAQRVLKSIKKGIIIHEVE